MNGIGYRQTVAWLSQASTDTQELIDTITLASVQYAKRQRTWFRRYEQDAQQSPKDRVVYKTIHIS